MKNWAGRLEGLKQVAFYMAPDDARVTPVRIPENIELVELITDGEVFFEVDGQEKMFGKGTIFWHREGDQTIWRTTPESPYRCAVFLFSVTDLNRPVSRVSFWNSDASIDRFAAECLNLFHAKELDAEVLTLYIYSTLLRHAMASGEHTASRDYPAPLNRALIYIHQNIETKISIAALADQSQISQPQLFRLFQAHLDTTPHRYILSHQLARARTLLAGSPLPIKAIAVKCGFESLEVFYRRFHRESGMPPGEYRHKYLPYRFPKHT